MSFIPELFYSIAVMQTAVLHTFCQGGAVCAANDDGCQWDEENFSVLCQKHKSTRTEKSSEIPHQLSIQTNTPPPSSSTSDSIQKTAAVASECAQSLA